MIFAAIVVALIAAMVVALVGAYPMVFVHESFAGMNKPPYLLESWRR
jgi:hypothetical protein